MNKKKLKAKYSESIKKNLEKIESYLMLKQNEINSNQPNRNEIVFAISLKSKQVSKNWDVVQDNLSKTLRSILNNTHSNYRIYIAGHEKPEINEMNHPSVNWLPVNLLPPKNIQGFTRDKMIKRKIIGKALKDRGFSGYFMPLDADDWVHFRFVEYINSLSHSKVIIIKRGLMINFYKKEIWLLDDFYLHCGSCAIFYFSNNELPSNLNEDKKMFSILTLNRHPKIIKYLKKFNIIYKTIDSPLVLRYFGHGENNMYLKGTLKRSVTANDYGSIGEPLGEWLSASYKTRKTRDIN